MPTVLFTASIEIRGINPYLLVSAQRAAILKPGWRKPLPVLVRINGKPTTPWRINMMPVGDGSFYLYLHADVRKASNTKVGDGVRAEVTLDTRYKTGPVHPLPRWFAAGLRGSPAAKKNWQALPPSRKKELLRYFSRLKSQAARDRNLERAINALAGQKMRFMAREWSGGS